VVAGASDPFEHLIEQSVQIAEMAIDLLGVLALQIKLVEKMAEEMAVNGGFLSQSLIDALIERLVAPAGILIGDQMADGRWLDLMQPEHLQGFFVPSVGIFRAVEFKTCGCLHTGKRAVR
jgi:hypothetical protein